MEGVDTTCVDPQAPATQPPTRRRPQRLCAVDGISKDEDLFVSSDEQNRSLRARFHGIKPSHFHASGVAVYALSGLAAPEGFESIWYNYDDDNEELSESEKTLLSAVKAILVIADIHDNGQLRSAVCLNNRIRLLSQDAAPMILIHHSASSRGKSCQLGIADFRRIMMARHNQIQSFIAGEPKGFRLALEVRSAIEQQAMKAELLKHELKIVREAAEERPIRTQKLQQATDHLVWQWCRTRLGTDIPDIDCSIGSCEPGTIVRGQLLGKVLGEGSFGAVYRLHDLARATPIDQVLKALPKKSTTCLRGVKDACTQIQTMRLLASEQYGHPHVSKLLDVYHSKSDILLRMSYGGPVDLYKRLKEREGKQAKGSSILGLMPVRRIMSQCIDALCHLHLRVKVAHLDIKPENIVLSGDMEDVNITLTDFGASLILPSSAYCEGTVGSFPFMAPEVLLQQRFNGFAADIWSLGVVFLELFCGIDILKKTLDLHGSSRRAMMLTIVDNLRSRGYVAALVEKSILSELLGFQDGAKVLLENLLKVSVSRRWTAAKLIEGLDASAAKNSFVATEEAAVA